MENFRQTLKEVFNRDAEEMPSARTAEPRGENRPAPAGASRPPVSFLAVGTAFEGTLRAAGDVEIAGRFKGSIASNGTVKLCSNVESSITAGGLVLIDCSLIGDVVSNGTVTVSEGSKIIGNVTARELLCAGEITGDLKIVGSTALEAGARINGRIATGTISVVRGAIIKGSMEMRIAEAEQSAETKQNAETKQSAEAKKSAPEAVNEEKPLPTEPAAAK